MGKLLIVAFAAAVGLPLACPAAPEPELEPCPAAGPCEEGQDVDDHGACDLEAGTWTPCEALGVDVNDDGEFGCTIAGESVNAVVSCDDCAGDWLNVDLGRTTISCPDLPTTDVVVAG